MTPRRAAAVLAAAALATVGTLAVPAAAFQADPPREKWDTRVFAKVPRPGSLMMSCSLSSTLKALRSVPRLTPSWR